MSFRRACERLRAVYSGIWLCRKKETVALNLQDAFTLFRRLGVDPEYLSRCEFSAAYFSLARRYHPDINPNTAELMANINVARETILKAYKSAETERPG